MTTVFVVFSFVFVFVLGANAASTIGTNMSTTGTLTVTPATNSATSVQFQNAASTTYFFADSTNRRVGVGGAPQTVFEVQGTASASYLMTANSLQVAGVASVAYSRFGTGTTGHSLAATDDVLFTGLVEFDDNAFFDAKVGIGSGAPFAPFEVQGTASASYFFTTGTLQAGGTFASATASVAYSRFGIGTTGTPGEFDAANDLLITGSLEVDGKASVAGNFQTSGRFIADTAASHSMAGDLILTSALTVGATTASGAGGTYIAQFVGPGTGTASFYFGGGNAATLGTCFQLKSSTGAWIYMSFPQGATAPVLDTTRCH
ncbi:MAG: hypothetical protein A3J47_04230 [Candidatus Yanofskybacteria bacterium RIFCSPHIGHO2_02_FULL_43_22]|uniref:Transferrin-binding protein B C-lobe/N-lobe beta barrel domain-containing protein n=1 Tax=Candidatus Yanofskybacteria bacterium RIFCSPHIGHO2_02_FULL_43_22 TaxID=1802681 RepID=A0A1F8FKI8_9BACT|nr:MAG: hypothetical protein A3J47_04230 [Candidatus Yanofskybacteria bacterium RIFCSPHIGHO2_02_FULL_43_22]